ncbi:GNAT family N-acetyltransferase [Cytobacillus horneckiae]|uniref:GNAT family N-acetyltransferase n=1 Tax=Cytobacillus horneckiae TaxID=549687 RepID=UPI003D9A94B8
MAIMIKLGKESEVHIAHQLMQEAFAEYSILEVPSSAMTESADVLRNAWRNGEEQFIVCYENETPVGSSRFKLLGDSLYFSRVSVSPQARGKGIAKQMLAWLEEYAQSVDRKTMTCKVRSSLESNVRLYKSIGFSIIEEGAIVNPNGFLVETAVMEKKL